jgi:hypothetical protein
MARAGEQQAARAEIGKLTLISDVHRLTRTLVVDAMLPRQAVGLRDSIVICLTIN